MANSKSAKENGVNGMENQNHHVQEEETAPGASFQCGRWVREDGDDMPRGLFLDSEEMKQKVRETLLKPEYNVADYYKPTGVWRDIATSVVFENMTLGVISINALWMAYDTDQNDATMLINAKPIFQVAEHTFCAYFSFEWFVRFMSFQKKRDGLRDAWFVFDSILVFMMVGETWVMTLVAVVLGVGGGGMGGASVLRLFRLLRLSRMARMLRSMPELMILIKGMIAAFRSVFFTLALLIMLIYIFSIAFRQLTEGYPAGDMYFSSIARSMWVLLINGTLLDNLTHVADNIAESSFVFAAIFLIFIALSALMVMNMLIGVLCEVVSAVAKTEKEDMTVTFVKGKMSEIIRQLDKNADGRISKKEFLQILGCKEAIQTLCEVGVDPIGLVDFADFIFTAPDDDGDQEVELDFMDFMEAVLDLRGSNVACVKDIMTLTKVFRGEIKRLENRLGIAQRLNGSGGSGKATPASPPCSPSNGRSCSSKRCTSELSKNAPPVPHDLINGVANGKPDTLSLPLAPHNQIVSAPEAMQMHMNMQAGPTGLTGLGDNNPTAALARAITFQPQLRDGTAPSSLVRAGTAPSSLARAATNGAPNPPWIAKAHGTASFATVGTSAKVDVLLQTVLAELHHMQLGNLPGALDAGEHPGMMQWARRMEQVIIAGLTDFHQLLNAEAMVLE